VKRGFGRYGILPPHVRPDRLQRKRQRDPLLIDLSDSFYVPIRHRAPNLPGPVLPVMAPPSTLHRLHPLHPLHFYRTLHPPLYTICVSVTS
jgi:hypothetical protein